MKSKIALLGVSLISYLFIVFYAPFHLAEMAEMKMPMEHCPFASAEHSLCSMSVIDHLKEWSSWMLAKNKSFNLFDLLGVATLSITIVFLLNTPKILRELLYQKRQRQRKIFSFLNFLFAIGILNPKIYFSI